MKALFAFTIGPVKSFIDNSRKMTDLYGGSTILSDLTKEATSLIKKETDFELIFPIVENENDNKYNIPNRFVTKIENFDIDNKNKYKEIAERLEKSIRWKFKSIVKETFKKSSIDGKNFEIAWNQMADFLEIFWLYEEYENNSKYSEAYNNIFKNLQAVKNIRKFEQTNESWGRKCTLFPEYNAIFGKKNDDKNIIDITYNEKLTYIVKPKEALSAIALFKRLYQKENIISLRNMLLEFYYEEIIYSDDYKENPTYIANAIYDINNGNTPSEDECPINLFESAEVIYENIKQNKIFLSSYYACIKFDGDNMGDAYRGKEESLHKSLSKKTSEFAISAKKIIHNSTGLCIYAGGEDVLAFLPIPKLFNTLEELHSKFYEKTGLTFSAGIAIAHLMQPLKEVLITASKMEHKAKQMKNKNSYALSIIKRSGELRTMCHEFFQFDKDYRKINILNGIINGLAKKDYSKGLIYDTILMLNQLSNSENDNEMLKIIIQKIFKQKKIPENNPLERQFKELLDETENLQDYIDCLDILGFLAREV